MRTVFISLVAVIVGLAMVVGGILGVVSDLTDDEDSRSSTSASAEAAKTSSPEECAQVAERDPRFKSPHDLRFSGLAGTATVQCDGEIVTFTIDVDGLKPSTFYEIVLEKGRREEVLTTFLVLGGVSKQTQGVGIGPQVKLSKYDYLTVRESEFHAGGKPTDEPLRAPL